MTITMTARNQITLPKKLVDTMHLSEGALFDIAIKGKRIELVPLKTVEQDFTDEEYAKMEKLYQSEKHLAKKFTAKFIENI